MSRPVCPQRHLCPSLLILPQPRPQMAICTHFWRHMAAPAFIGLPAPSAPRGTFENHNTCTSAFLQELPGAPTPQPGLRGQVEFGVAQPCIPTLPRADPLRASVSPTGNQPDWLGAAPGWDCRRLAEACRVGEGGPGVPGGSALPPPRAGTTVPPLSLSAVQRVQCHPALSPGLRRCRDRGLWSHPDRSRGRTVSPRISQMPVTALRPHRARGPVAPRRELFQEAEGCFLFPEDSPSSLTRYAQSSDFGG